MTIRTLIKFTFPIVLLFGIVASGYYFFLLPRLTLLSQSKQNKQVAVSLDKSFGWKFPVAKFPLTGSNGKLIAYSSVRDPGGIPQGLPVRLQIPVIGVDSAIEDALITPDGRMDVPAGSANVAWFALGPHPGSVGSAVIGGHFGIENGVPFVFYNLDKVKVGDKVFIIDDKNATHTFVVRAIKSFDRNGDSTSVFTSQDGIAHLNLITCEGIWNQVNGAYPQRLVIFTDAIPAEGAVTVNKQGAVVATTKDVAKVTPLPTQIPVPSTTSSTSSSSNAAGASPISAVRPTSFPQTLIMSAKGLYETPIDGLITSLLLIAIAFIAFTLIRRS